MVSFIYGKDQQQVQVDMGDLCWGYRKGRKGGSEAALKLVDQVLNLKSRISPSLTMYSLPSSRALPASLAALSPPSVV